MPARWSASLSGTLQKGTRNSTNHKLANSSDGDCAMGREEKSLIVLELEAKTVQIVCSCNTLEDSAAVEILEIFVPEGMQMKLRFVLFS